MGYFSYTQVNVTVEKRDADQDVKKPSDSSRELSKNNFIGRIPIFKRITKRG